MKASRREMRSYLPEVKEELRLREELKKAALPTAAYCRKSVMDPDEDSIENQIAIVQNYIGGNPELRLVDTYVDNGISGTSFDRPEWKRMVRDVQEGRISCIVVKDLSRFARDYIEAGTYIEDVFPKLGVRFIAITDNYDNTAGDTIQESMMVPAKNILNDLYARDTGRKQHLVREKMRMEGKATAVSCPFGYTMADKKIVPDPEQAPVVKLMFTWAEMGVPVLEIAERLVFLGITTKAGCKWDQKQVRELLMNEAFVGNLVLGKTSYRNGVRIRVPREEWRVFPDDHEAIVDRELFDRVQERLRPEKAGEPEKPVRQEDGRGDADENTNSRTAEDAERADENAMPWCGMVRCAFCGKPMRPEKKRGDRLICYRHTGGSATEKNLDKAPGIQTREMEILVFRRCRKFRKDIEKIMLLADAADRKGGVAETMEKKATDALAETKKEQAKLDRLYGDYCAGLLDENDYLELSDRCKEQMEKSREALNAVLSEQRKLKTSVLEIRALWEALDGVARMTPEKVKEIVEFIEVTDEKQIAVRFRHQEAIDLFMAYGKGERK